MSRPFLTIASVTPMSFVNPRTFDTEPVPPSSTPARSGINLNVTLIIRFTDSRMNACINVGAIGLMNDSVMNTSNTPARWKHMSNTKIKIKLRRLVV